MNQQWTSGGKTIDFGFGRNPLGAVVDQRRKRVLAFLKSTPRSVKRKILVNPNETLRHQLDSCSTSVASSTVGIVP